MVTLAELYERFSQAKEWQRLAAVMRRRVSDIILRPHGETDANIVTREMLRRWQQRRRAGAVKKESGRFIREFVQTICNVLIPRTT